MSEYGDAVARAARLAAAREAYVTRAPAALHAVTLDDALIYLRALVCQLHATAKVNQFLKVRSEVSLGTSSGYTSTHTSRVLT